MEYCDTCNSRLEGEVPTFRNKAYCNDCANRFFKCRECGFRSFVNNKCLNCGPILRQLPEANLPTAAEIKLERDIITLWNQIADALAQKEYPIVFRCEKYDSGNEWQGGYYISWPDNVVQGVWKLLQDNLKGRSVKATVCYENTRAVHCFEFQRKNESKHLSLPPDYQDAIKEK